MTVGLRFLSYIIPVTLIFSFAFGYYLYIDIISSSKLMGDEYLGKYILLMLSFSFSIIVLISAVFSHVVINGLKRVILNTIGKSDIGGVASNDEFKILSDIIHNIEKSNEQNISKINALITHDELTHLPNKVSLNKDISSSISSYFRDGVVFSLLLINIKSFKKFNDRFGVLFGDSLIVAASNRLQEICEGERCHGNECTVYRMGGDEFMVKLVGVCNPDLIHKICTKIISILESPFEVNLGQQSISVSIGVSIFPDHADEKYELLKYSDLALHEAKNSSDSKCVIFNHSIMDKLRYESDLEIKIIQAIESDEFDVFYQPKVRVHNGEENEFEALVRWNPPGEKSIPPGLFIPFAEQKGLIDKIGVWVVGRVVSDIKKLYSKGFYDFKISINISPKQLRDYMDNDLLTAILVSNDINPANIEIEITEHSFADEIDKVVSYLKKIRAIGVSVSVDDFGTGYSSLSYLQSLPIDTLKIDRSFISGVDKDRSKEAIVSTIIRLAKGLNLSTVAEGVETTEELRFVSDMECDLVQGYYFYKPAPFEDMVSVLSNQKQD